MFSIDTNLVLGVVNPCDRLNEKSTMLVHKEIKKSKLIIFTSVITESKETSFRKCDKSIKKVIEILREVNNQTDDQLERIGIFRDKFNQLMKENKNLVAFMKLIRQLITPFVQRWDIRGAFICLSEFAFDFSNTIEDILYKEVGHKIKFFKLELNEEELEKITNIKDIISSYGRFKDKFDKTIFIEIVLYSIHEEEFLKFYSNDKEFMKTSNMIFNKILDEPKYPHAKIDFLRI